MSEAPLTSPHAFLSHAGDDLLWQGAEVPRAKDNLNFRICVARAPAILRHVSDLDCDANSIGFGNGGVISTTGLMEVAVSGVDSNFGCWYLRAAWSPGVSDGNAGIKNTKGGHIWPMKPVKLKVSDDFRFLGSKIGPSVVSFRPHSCQKVWHLWASVITMVGDSSDFCKATDLQRWSQWRPVTVMILWS